MALTIPNRAGRYQLAAAATFIAALALFQNCSPNSKFESNQISKDELIGKLFATYGVCGENRIGVKGEILFSDDMKTAEVRREDCLDVNPPRSIDPKVVDFLPDTAEKTVFVYGGLIFDLQAGEASQRVTRISCRGGAGAEFTRAVLRLDSSNQTALQGTLSTGSLQLHDVAMETTASGTATVFASSAALGDSFELTVQNSGEAQLRLTTGATEKTIDGLKCESQAQPHFLPSSTAMLFRSLRQDDGRPRLRFGIRDKSESAPELFFLFHEGTTDSLVYTYGNLSETISHDPARNAFGVDMRNLRRWNEGIFLSSTENDGRIEARVSTADPTDVCLVRSNDPAHVCVARYLGALASPDFPGLQAGLRAIQKDIELRSNAFIAAVLQNCSMQNIEVVRMGEVLRIESFVFSAVDARFTHEAGVKLTTTLLSGYAAGSMQLIMLKCAPYFILQLSGEYVGYVSTIVDAAYASNRKYIETHFNATNPVFNDLLKLGKTTLRPETKTRDAISLLHSAILDAKYFSRTPSAADYSNLYSYSYLKQSYDLISAQPASPVCDGTATLADGGWREDSTSCRQPALTQAAVLSALGHLGGHLLLNKECSGPRFGDSPATCASIRDALLKGLAFVDSQLVSGTAVRDFPAGLGQGDPAMIGADHLVNGMLIAYYFLTQIAVSDDTVITTDFGASTMTYGELRAHGMAFIKAWFAANPGGELWATVAALRVAELVTLSATKFPGDF